MARYDLARIDGRLGAYWHFAMSDHGILRTAFTNAHWIDEKMVRTNQPWPYQLKYWQERGIRTVLNLRGRSPQSWYLLEQEAAEALGMTLVTAPLGSREVPSKERILLARDLFERIEYPALMHCKSGADRAGLMAVLYRHFHLGHPISEAVEELGFRTLHVRQGLTGVLDYFFEYYLAEIEPRGISFIDWVTGDSFDPDALKATFKANWWGKVLTEKVLRRE